MILKVFWNKRQKCRCRNVFGNDTLKRRNITGKHSFTLTQNKTKLQKGRVLWILSERMREIDAFYVPLIWYFTGIQNIFIGQNHSSSSENSIILHWTGPATGRTIRNNTSETQLFLLLEQNQDNFKIYKRWSLSISSSYQTFFRVIIVYLYKIGSC